MNFKVVPFKALTPQQLYTIYHLRVTAVSYTHLRAHET
ncbi:hypothetical protein MUDAN_IGPPGNFN_03641 [Lactiplantibacillus mudanjiangensis]|nr:hypothetical protein MUDAN_IGPPGNFN_03641 [Lactiplantibacillus mudanjiangensis]